MAITLEAVARKVDDVAQELRGHVDEHKAAASRNQARLNIALAVLSPVTTALLLKALHL
jgi:hypothetical protein